MRRSPIRFRRLTLETLEVRRVLENHAPVLDTSGPEPLISPSLVVNNEESTPGALVSDLLGTRATDADGDPLGIAIIGFTFPEQPRFGGWYFSVSGASRGYTSLSTGYPGDPYFGAAPSDQQALLLGPSARLLFAAGMAGAKLEFRAWDMSDGAVPGSIVDTTGRQGSSGAFSAASELAKGVSWDAPLMRSRDDDGYYFFPTSNYGKDGPAVIINPELVIADFGIYNLPGRTLEVQTTLHQVVEAIRDEHDVLAIGSPFTVDTSNQVLLNGEVIGVQTSDGHGTDPLKIVLSARATQPIVQQLARSITFRSAGGDLGNRCVEFNLRHVDFDSAVETAQNRYAAYTTMRVTSYGRMTPVIALGGPTAYQVNDPPVFVAPQATLANSDLEKVYPSYGSTWLTVKIEPSSVNDALGIGGPFVPDQGFDNLDTYAGVGVSLGNGNNLIGQLVSDGAEGRELKMMIAFYNKTADVQLLMRSITYQNINGEAGPRTITFTLHHDTDVTAVATTTVDVTSSGEKVPLGSLNGEGIEYTLGDAPVSIAPQATLVPTETVFASFPDMNHALLVVAVDSASADDRLAVGAPFTVDSAGQIRLPGTTTVLASQFVDSDYRLRFLFDGITRAQFELLLRSITFQDVHGSAGRRTVTFDISYLTLNYDGLRATGTTIINIVDPQANIAPVLELSGTLRYRLGDAAVVLAPSAGVQDANSSNFAGGELRVQTATNNGLNNALAIGNGFAVDAAGNVSQGGVVIGRRTGDGLSGHELEVLFSEAATPAMVQALVRSVTYRNLSGTAGTRQVVFTVSDGDGGTSPARIKFVEVVAPTPADPPVIGSFGDNISFTEGGPTKLVAASATVTDYGSPSFAAGVLSARITSNAGADDRLFVATVGVVSTSGSQVRVDGVVIGSFTGGSSSVALKISLNSAATAARVQAVVRAIAFRNTSAAPSTAARQLSVFVSDGDGGTSVVATKSIRVVAVNNAPVLAGIDGSLNYTLDSAEIVLAAAATVADVDSFNFGGGKLRVRIGSGGGAANRLAIGSGFTVDGNHNVLQGTKIIGRLNANGGSGTTELIVTFNTAATRAIVQSLARSITFRTAGGNSGARTVLFSLYDGDGGSSAELSRTVNVT